MLDDVVPVPYGKEGFSPMDEEFTTATPQPPSSEYGTYGAIYAVQDGIIDDLESNGRTQCSPNALCTVHRYQILFISKTSTISK